MAQPTYLQQNNTGNVNSYNTTNNYNNIVNHNRAISVEDAQILQWLSPLEPQSRHRSVRTDRLDGVGNWLLETSEFREWSNSTESGNQAVFFCSGNPGVGKTYLNSLVIDSLCDNAGERDIAVVMLYCDFKGQQEQSTTNMLGAVLKQLVGRDEIPDHVRQTFRKGKRFSDRGLRLPDLVKMLKATIASIQQVFICIDALDEFAQKSRVELFESLREIMRESPSTRVFLTGRPHIREEIRRYFSEAVEVPVSPNEGDILRYLGMKLDRDPDPDAMDDDLRADILRIIPPKISEIFLLVSLKIDAILAEVTIYQRRKKLYEMTKDDGLKDAYTTTLARIKAQKGSKSRLGMEVLLWVSHSERPLEVNELCHALGVERGSTDLNIHNIPTIQTLLGCSLGLVTVEAASSRVRLIHFTLQEHLSQDLTLFQNPHPIMAEVCLTYLNFECVKDLSLELHSIPSTTPLVEYASHHWASHARRGSIESVKQLALELLVGCDKHISSQLIYRTYINPMWFFFGTSTFAGFTGLHAAAFFGIVEILAALLEMKEWDLNLKDSKGNTPIAWAVKRGHESIVNFLINRKDVNMNATDNEGRTLLSWAAEKGDEGIVEILLHRKDLNPNTTDKMYGWTPLLWAVRKGYEGVVRILLEREDVNPDTADNTGRTPLSWAALSGSKEVVKTLLEREDVNPDTADNTGRTPLSWAATSWVYGKAVRILLRDVDPSAADNAGGAPLSWAAANWGCGYVVRILLEREDVNPNTAENTGRTLLSWAAEAECEEIIRILLEREDVNPNTADNTGRTPLSWAALSGSKEAVKILLEREDVNPDTADNTGRTPLSWAALSGSKEVVKTLLEREDVNLNTTDDTGKPPLTPAVIESIARSTAKFLLQSANLDPDITTHPGQTAATTTSDNSHESASKPSLKCKLLDPNASVHDYSTESSSPSPSGTSSTLKRIRKL